MTLGGLTITLQIDPQQYHLLNQKLDILGQEHAMINQKLDQIIARDSDEERAKFAALTADLKKSADALSATTSQNQP